jgi:uncharacterized protein (TIGR02996 family)
MLEYCFPDHPEDRRMARTADDGFLEAIIATPDDDALRLIYADWLEDHGESVRAEFIRVQIELARLPNNDPRRLALTAREGELCAKHRLVLLRGLPRLAWRGGLRRGFLETLTVTVRQFLQIAPRLRRLTPLRDLALTFPSEVLAELAACPHLAGLASLRFPLGDPKFLRPGGVSVLASSPYLEGLTTLDLDYNRIVARDAEALAFSPHLASLTELHLEGCYIGPAGARFLSDSPYLTRLARLQLRYNDLGNAGAEALASAPRLLNNLTELYLRFNRIGTAGAIALAACPHLGKLTTLELTGNAIHRAGARALAESPHLRPALREQFRRLSEA